MIREDPLRECLQALHPKTTTTVFSLDTNGTLFSPFSYSVLVCLLNNQDVGSLWKVLCHCGMAWAGALSPSNAEDLVSRHSIVDKAILPFEMKG